jgi:CRP-like cAMP-binding protein
MMFADLDMASAAPLLAAVTHEKFGPGERIYPAGGKPGALFSVRRGVIKLSSISPEGDLRIVRLLGPGTTFGLEAMLKEPYHHLAESLSDSEICRIPAGSVREIADHQRQLCARLMAQWDKHVELADNNLLNLSAGTIKARVANLLTLIDSLCRRGNTPFVLPNNQDCAALVAARVESVSRVMAELKRNGVLRQDERGQWQFDSGADL